MQLEAKPGALRRQLAIAVLALLGTTAVHGQGNEPATGRAGAPSADPGRGDGSDTAVLPPGTESKDWQIDAGALYYGESGGRIQTGEAVVNLKRTYSDESELSIKLTVDALTGGSPNGALPSHAVQTFATPSGSSLTPGQSGHGEDEHSSVYTVGAGQLPMDKSFHDERFALSATRDQPVGNADHLSYGAAVSRELDFQSLSANIGIAHDLNDKNTTLSLGVNVEADSIRPIGGAPVAGSDYAQFRKEGSKSKRVSDIVAGVTQVMNRRWLTRLNYSRDHSNGYQNDPYKIVSVLQSDGSIALDPGGNPYYLYESRPEARTRTGWYWDNKLAIGRDVLQFSYRYMSDDWGIRSHTFDLHYRWAFGDGSYLEPHLRRYRQDAADFYRLYVPNTGPLPAFVSADPRLAKFDANTWGLKWGRRLGQSGEISLRVEQYAQSGKVTDAVPTQLQGLDLYPGLKAWLVQGGLRYAF